MVLHGLNESSDLRLVTWLCHPVSRGVLLILKLKVHFLTGRPFVVRVARCGGSDSGVCEYQSLPTSC